MNTHAGQFGAIVLSGLLLTAAGRAAEDTYRLRERFPVGHLYHVRTRVELSGTLTPSPVKGKQSRPVTMQGSSAIDYDERILSLDDKGAVKKTIRICRRLDFRRTLAGQSQELSLRSAVRRLVILRRGPSEVPFSPDGPLTWGEIDAVRTDVFAPALAGLLPAGNVKVGERWTAAEVAVQELTDLEKIDEGKIGCRLERIVSAGKRRLARVTFSGTIRGVGEDGTARHRIQGHCHLDLDAGFLIEVVLNGTTTLLDGDGKEVGRIDGRFVMMREPGGKTGELTDTALKSVKVEPDADNTLMLYDNPDLGVRFLYARRWRVAQVMGPQVALDNGEGCGVLITIDPLERVPTSAAFMSESRGWLEKQKAKLIKVYTPRKLRESPALEGFALEAQMQGQRIWMDYYVTRQTGGGATLAARLTMSDLAELRKEVDRIARSVVITRKIDGKR
jgi:hypothetical protein